jgi:spore coat polysaccharide biosynthesis predicted glycosyltransferase SpsG
MRVVLRADASRTEGSGHVMRCLTLSEALVARGHAVQLAVTVDGIPWLSNAVAAVGLPVLAVEAGKLSADLMLSVDPDWVVVDSYELPAEQISGLGERVPVLAIVDGELRGIRAALYLEQNLGSDELDWDVPDGGRILAGGEFALIRDAVLSRRRPDPWAFAGTPRLVVVLGGTDPLGIIVPVAAQLAGVDVPTELTLVAAPEHHSEVMRLLAGHPSARVVAPSSELAELLGAADLAVSAAGTSAWEICALGLPGVLIAVVDNQTGSLNRMADQGLVLGIDLTADPAGLDRLGGLVEQLVTDEATRRSLSRRATALFDGLGKRRVVEAMETAPSGHPS